jgi:outer membrane protein OmpA-like peptidoglycan-associated protein
MSGAILRDIQDKGFSVVPILFAFDKAEILPASREQITAIVLSLQEQPDLCMRIEGHTDAAGDPVYNRDLSRLRAEAVQAAILAQGIAEKRLQALGWGAERPVADNSAQHGRAQNRRVELHRMDCP